MFTTKLNETSTITIPNQTFNSIDVEFHDMPDTALRFTSKDIDCFVPNMDYFHFSVYESKIGNKYIYNLGIGNQENYSINNLVVGLYKFKVVYTNGICKLEFTKINSKFNVLVRFANTYRYLSIR